MKLLKTQRTEEGQPLQVADPRPTHFEGRLQRRGYKTLGNLRRRPEAEIDVPEQSCYRKAASLLMTLWT